MQPAGGSAHPASLETVAARQHVIQMEGRQVFRFATRIMPEAARQALDRAGLTVEDVNLFVPHQANDRILQSAARGLGVPEERMFSNLGALWQYLVGIGSHCPVRSHRPGTGQP